MCRRISCDRCGRPGFAGCGRHIDQVLGDVPPAERCRCDEAPAEEAPTSPAEARPRWWAFLDR